MAMKTYKTPVLVIGIGAVICLNLYIYGRFLIEIPRNHLIQRNESVEISDMDRPAHFTMDEEDWMDEWIKVSDGLWVFSAYLDNRPKQKPMVRIIATGIQTPKPLQSTDFLCYGLFDNSPTLASLDMEIFYLGDNNQRKPAAALYVHCFLKSSTEKPIYVIVLPKKNSGESLNKVRFLKVHNVDGFVPEKVERKLAVCVRPSFGFSQNISRVAEWMAMWRILGADHFVLYDFKMDQELLSFFNYLRYHGNVSLDIIPWRLFPVQKTSQALAQMEFSGDCVYRHAHSHELVALLDFDEILFPVVDDNLLDLINKMDMSQPKKQYSSYCFRQYLMCPPSTAVKFLTQSWVTRDSEVLKCGRLSKYIVRPMRSLVPSVHSEYKRLPAYEWCCMPEELGVSHHYRSRPKCDSKFRVETALRYAMQFENSTIMRSFEEFEKISKNLSSF